MSSKKGSRGFVFLAVLGVMAVTILLTFAVSSSTQFSYQRTGAALLDVQERLMAQSAADYALRLLAEKTMAADGKPHAFRFLSDQRTSATVAGTVEVTPATPNQPAYKIASLAHRGGDVIVRVISEDMLKQWGRGERFLLGNVSGGRARLIDVTAAYKGGM